MVQQLGPAPQVVPRPLFYSRPPRRSFHYYYYDVIIITITIIIIITITIRGFGGAVVRASAFHL
jgi:hypothetical protein